MATRNALDVAKRELLASLDQLPPDAQFAVVFYNLRATVFADDQGHRGLMAATKAHKAQVRTQLASIVPDGGTDHMLALRAALKMRPEVIFFLTDADLMTNGDVTELLAERGFTGYDLRLMSPANDVSGIPTEGKNLIIVAAVNRVLHFRIFDGDGQVVVDTDEKRLTKQARPIEDLGKQLEGFDLRLMSTVNDEISIPTEGRNLVIVAVVDEVLHFRIFDAQGKRVVDKDEAELPEWAHEIEQLKGQLKDLWAVEEPPKSDKARVISSVTSIVGHTQLESLWPPHVLTTSEKGRLITAVTSIVGQTRSTRIQAVEFGRAPTSAPRSRSDAWRPRPGAPTATSTSCGSPRSCAEVVTESGNKVFGVPQGSGYYGFKGALFASQSSSEAQALILPRSLATRQSLMRRLLWRDVVPFGVRPRPHALVDHTQSLTKNSPPSGRVPFASSGSEPRLPRSIVSALILAMAAWIVWTRDHVQLPDGPARLAPSFNDAVISPLIADDYDACVRSPRPIGQSPSLDESGSFDDLDDDDKPLVALTGIMTCTSMYFIPRRTVMPWSVIETRSPLFLTLLRFRC